MKNWWVSDLSCSLAVWHAVDDVMLCGIGLLVAERGLSKNKIFDENCTCTLE